MVIKLFVLILVWVLFMWYSVKGFFNSIWLFIFFDFSGFVEKVKLVICLCSCWDKLFNVSIFVFID